MSDCIHNERSRYTHGFYCRECCTFFGKETPTYRSGELLSSIWMVLNNINVDLFREGKQRDVEVTELKDWIGIGKKHPEDYEEIIKESERIMFKYDRNSDSASITLGEDTV